MEINQRISELLKTFNLTQKELCENIGVSTSTLNNWLKLNRSIPSEYIIPICKFFDVSAYNILLGKDIKAELLSDEHQELLLLWNKLDPMKQAEFKGLLMGYIKAKEEGEPKY